MSFPYFISPEQAMRERSELARKGIARGRSVVALAYADGVLFVAENPSRSLQKVSEIYDRIGFAAVGRFNEFDNLRRGGIQYADTRGYAYDRRDVSGRQLANQYAQALGGIFTEQAKPYEVELCVAEVAHHGETKAPELYRITYDGSIADEPHFVVMGGTTEPIIEKLNESYAENTKLSEAVKIAVDALKAGGNGSDSRNLGPDTLEVAILDANRPRSAFRRITGAAWRRCCPKTGRLGGVAHPGLPRLRTDRESRRNRDLPAGSALFRVYRLTKAPPVNHVLRKARCVASSRCGLTHAKSCRDGGSTFRAAVPVEDQSNAGSSTTEHAAECHEWVVSIRGVAGRRQRGSGERGDGYEW